MAYIAYVDGACHGNPGGVGGIGVVITTPDGKTLMERKGALAGEDITNNRMELAAALAALDIVPTGNLTIFSDSEYVVRGMTENRRRNANRDLWEKLEDRQKAHQGRVEWRWIAGRGSLEHDRAHRLAQAAVMGYIHRG